MAKETMKADRGQTIVTHMARDDSSHKVAQPKKMGGSPMNLSATSSATPKMKD